MSPTNLAIDIAEQGRKNLEASEAWRRIEQEFLRTGDAAVALRALSQATERTAAKAYQVAMSPVLSGRAVMLAAGAFAREDLFPYSHADIVIVREGDAPNLNQGVTEFVRMLWEKGVRPNPRVLTIAEFASMPERNTDLSIRLLDRRMLAGDSDFAETVERELAAVFTAHAPKLAQCLIAQARARHKKFEGTPSHREPDVYESPGGIRDRRLVANIEKLCPQQVNVEDMSAAAARLAKVRCFLHFHAREDRNLWDAPAQAAFASHFADDEREYFRHARKVFTEARRAMDSCESPDGSLHDTIRDAQSRLSNDEFTVVKGRLFLRRPTDLEQAPELVLRLAEFVARHGVPLAPETERRLQAARDAVARYCAEPHPLWSTIRSILALPYASDALRAFQYTDLLSAIFPEWLQIEGVVTNNPDDRYTLDERTLVAIERISDLRGASENVRQRFFEVFSDIGTESVLLFTVLFHLMGNSEAMAAAERIGMPAPDRELMAFLIEHQSSLSGAVRGRDLDDPATVRMLSDRIGTVERLRSLAKLTAADIAATYSETAIPWRLDQLWRTFHAIQQELTRELETNRIEDLPSTLPKSADFIRGFPARYLRARTAAEIEKHTRLYELSASTGVSLELEPVEGAYKLTIVAHDKPGLFASFAGAISSFGLDILRAEAFGNAKGVILDTFVLADPKRTLSVNPPEAERLQDLIRRIALGKTEARRLFRNQAKVEIKKRTIEPRVEFDSEACETATLVEIVAEDRPGLLYALATVFSSNTCNIDTVLIDTKGQRAIDVFYVAKDGRKLSAEFQAALKEQLLLACVGVKPE